jgi:hypothetical protein
MPDDLTPPRRLDRAALDRVLHRAAELQSHSIESADASGMLSEEQIIELGREAGMSPEHLRQAIAEERTRSPVADEKGLAASIIGPAQVRASRVVPGKPAELLDVIDAWMQGQESLQVKRRIADRIVWEPRRDFLSGIQRGLNLGGRGYALTKAAEVAATTTAIDPNRTLVALDGQLAEYRGGLAIGATVATGFGAAATAIGVLLLPAAIPLAIIPAIAAPAIAIAGSRSAQAKAVNRAQLALEQLLDHLERGDHRRPGGLLAAITATAASALQGRL